MNEPTIEQPGARADGEPHQGGLGGYIRRQWHGDNSLLFAFWVNFVLGVFLAQSVVALLYFATEVSAGGLGFLLIGILNVATLCMMLWASVGVWRSAGASIAKARAAEPPRTLFWGYGARVALVLLLVVPMSPFSIWRHLWLLAI